MARRILLTKIVAEGIKRPLYSTSAGEPGLTANEIVETSIGYLRYQQNGEFSSFLTSVMFF